MTSWLSKSTLQKLLDLHNIRKIRPFLTQHAAQLTVQALVISRLDYCNALLAGLPSCTTKPLQMIQNAAARLVFCEPKRAHVTPLFISLHWFPVAARIKFKTLMCHHREAQNPSPERFHSPFLAGGLNFPPSSGMLDPWQFSSNTWKLISSVITWLHLKKKKINKHLLPFLNFALFSLNSHRLARICSEQCLDICITSTPFVCLPVYNVLLIVFLNCKSLWIKASAKWINVNVALASLAFQSI